MPLPAYAGEPVAPVPDHPDATVRAAMALGLIGYGASLGLPLPDLLGMVGMSPQQMTDPDAQVPVQAMKQLVARIDAAAGGRSVGLEMVAMASPNIHALVELAAHSASTIGEAMDLHLRYARLTSSHAQTWLERQPPFAAIRLRHLASVEVLTHPLEIGIALVHRGLRRLGATNFTEVHLPHAPAGPLEAYEAHFGCPVHTESFGTALVFPLEVLDRPCAHADPVLSRSVIARLEKVLPDGDDALADLRRAIAAHAAPAQYSAASIATRMGRSLRSLQREALQAGTTLRQTIEDVRVARAKELLGDDGLSVDEVGFLVDYSERAAFSRAFKRATGQTPAEFRRSGAN
ncbi:MAG: AraC family transcriptional regulator [Deltaproteobacteria bacterium]|nr:MAG: AraC family transcriptional regulator [Deltaproteobacteria bacterium]